MAETERANTAISVENLRVSYGTREILHGISFDVMKGETLVILGGSGAVQGIANGRPWTKRIL